MHTTMPIPAISIYLQEDKPGKHTYLSISLKVSHLRREIDQSADRPG